MERLQRKERAILVPRLPRRPSSARRAARRPRNETIAILPTIRSPYLPERAAEQNYASDRRALEPALCRPSDLQDLPAVCLRRHSAASMMQLARRDVRIDLASVLHCSLYRREGSDSFASDSFSRIDRPRSAPKRCFRIRLISGVVELIPSWPRPRGLRRNDRRSALRVDRIVNWPRTANSWGAGEL